MKKGAVTLLSLLVLGLALAGQAQAAFGVQDFHLGFGGEPGTSATQAGSHPRSVTTELRFKTRPDPVIGETPEGAIRNFDVALPPGLVGRPSAVPRCSEAAFRELEPTSGNPTCPDSSAVGTVIIKGFYEEPIPGSEPLYVSAPVWNLPAAPGSVQKLGFWVQGLVPVVIEFSVSQTPPYRVVAKLSDVNQTIPIYSAKLALWGNPANPVHDVERGHCIFASVLSPIQEERLNLISGCSIPAGTQEAPYVTLGTSCSSPLLSDYLATSWEGAADAGQSASPALTGCGRLGFGPTIAAAPTTAVGQSSSGLGFNLDVADQGLANPSGLAQSDIRRTEVTLPEGMTVNPSLANGLGACSVADLQRETLAARAGEGCPQSSKIGSVEVETPLLDQALVGNLYAARPYENQFGSLLAIYLVIKNQNLGVIVKQALQVIPNERTGQLTAIADDIPQLPFSHFRLNFRGGERAPLTTPAGCGTYDTKAVLTPWSGGPPVTTTSAFQITVGAGGSCAANPFKPTFEAGTLTPLAGKYSPFVLNLTRPAGSPRISSLNATLPEGLLARLRGVAECSEAAIAAAAARGGPGGGVAEQTAPSCPAASQVGTVDVGAGSGDLTFVRGRAYLAGPYKGAPLSLVIVTPAVAGPFDLGAVVVRNALYVDPTSARITAVSDPLPTILRGIPLDIRRIAVSVDRPEFTLNPTSCEPMAILGGATSLLGQSAALSDRFQVGGCGALGFSPKLSLKLSGSTKRAKNPALKAVLTQPRGQAGIKRVSVLLPKIEFIDNRHISNPCTRPQFAADRCPAGSILGRARAYSPLLDQPLTGLVYFRSNGGERELPDLVVDLHGQIDVQLVGFIDSVQKKGSESSRIRNTFATVPDAPVSKFVLELKGGKRGLLQNSDNLCKHRNQAKIAMRAHNGARYTVTRKIGVKCRRRHAK